MEARERVSKLFRRWQEHLRDWPSCTHLMVGRHDLDDLIAWWKADEVLNRPVTPEEEAWAREVSIERAERAKALAEHGIYLAGPMEELK